MTGVAFLGVAHPHHVLWADLIVDRMDDVRLIGAYDRDAGKARAFAQKYNTQVLAREEILQPDEVDHVVVNGRNYENSAFALPWMSTPTRVQHGRVRTLPWTAPQDAIDSYLVKRGGLA